MTEEVLSGFWMLGLKPEYPPVQITTTDSHTISHYFYLSTNEVQELS